jgi:hypothetical protein
LRSFSTQDETKAKKRDSAGKPNDGERHQRLSDEPSKSIGQRLEAFVDLLVQLPRTHPDGDQEAFSDSEDMTLLSWFLPCVGEDKEGQ